MSADRDRADIPPDNGVHPRFATPIREGVGDAGSGAGYSGEEYDGAGQKVWRAEQERCDLAPDGAVRGSGVGAGGDSPGEDFDIDTHGRVEPA